MLITRMIEQPIIGIVKIFRCRGCCQQIMVIRCFDPHR